MSSNASDAEVFVYTGGRRAEVPDDVVHVRVDSSVRPLPKHFIDAMCWPRWSCVKASLKLGLIPSRGGTATR
jgi:hypothetical protein